MWKVGIALAGVLLLLVLIVWVPVSAAGAYEGASGLATPVTGTVQVTPTEDATVTALKKEKLAQEVQQLKNQNALDIFGWLRTNAAILLSTLVVVIGGLIGLFRWFGDRRDAQDKDLKAQAEERFKTAVAALGDEKEGVQVGGAILLRTFLRPGYEQFYIQTFDLTVANLRLRRASPPPEDPDGIPYSPEDPKTPLPLTPLSLALIVVFKEAFPLARDWLKEQDPKTEFHPQSLDASDIQLDYANLMQADLKQVGMVKASLRKASFFQADLSGADLIMAKLSGADLSEADLSGADLSETQLSLAHLSGAQLSKADLSGADLIMAKLSGADLSGAKLISANLMGADLSEADLSGADLTKADLSKADLTKADLSGALLYETNLMEAKLSKDLSEAHLSGAKLLEADLSGTNLSGADLIGADLRRANLSTADLRRANLTGTNLVEADLSGADLSGAILYETNLSKANLDGVLLNFEDTLFLNGNDLRGVKGLTKEQKEACKAKGAIIDEDTLTSPPQSPVSPPPPSQSNNVQAPSAPPAQVNTPTPETDGSSTASSQPGTGY